MKIYSLMMICILLVLLQYFRETHILGKIQYIRVKHADTGANKPPITLVLYAYFEKDAIQRENFDFFIKQGIGIGNKNVTVFLKDTHFSVAVNGHKCSPCVSLVHYLSHVDKFPEGVQGAWAGKRITLLHRKENTGMDIAAHNATLEYMKENGTLYMYKYYIFLNSSVRGPFYPTYMPSGWQWTTAFTQRLTGASKIVGSSLVCLPPEDPGGHGPKIESWAFALDDVSLALVLKVGTFHMRTCKVCHGHNGIVVMGEYAMSKAILEAGYNLQTLMSRMLVFPSTAPKSRKVNGALNAALGSTNTRCAARYALDVDWRDTNNWNCNNNVHPSRHGTYDGISMHPYETMFVKSSWHVGEPHLSRYSKWLLEHTEGHSGTHGSFDEQMYYYAMCLEGRYPEDTNTLFVPKNLTCTGS